MKANSLLRSSPRRQASNHVFDYAPAARATIFRPDRGVITWWSPAVFRSSTPITSIVILYIYIVICVVFSVLKLHISIYICAESKRISMQTYVLVCVKDSESQLDLYRLPPRQLWTSMEPEGIHPGSTTPQGCRTT